MNFQKEVDNLFSSQLAAWPQLRAAVERLADVQVKDFEWGDNVAVRVQYNPGRMVSTGARLCAKDVAKRPCFLCETNRPAEQIGLTFRDKYIVLCNPYPILSNHLTIALHTHVPQRIRKKIVDLLALAELLPDYVVFYNAEGAGASAPDHCHFQAGLKQDVLLAGDNALRSCFVIEAMSMQEAEDCFEHVYRYLQSLQPDREEPMMNIVAYLGNDHSAAYCLHVFPRKAHRPHLFSANGSQQIIVSPGALDMAGLLITVRREDFEIITKADIEDIYMQVSRPVM